ncbi:type II toxin-antitoxin system RelE/ParE family toxin [Cellvibrio fontiphilus]|jgi:toxin ParE1/3/4|uniref:Type II toxin-antitoxin system RelE/ParE family toxin n=1 Tax=Cellvibrio fontiphilus TaxID=1815559 RepID=A0ABV7F977_9GAMM
MSLAISFTAGAERDLFSIYDYIAEHDSPQKADQLLDQLQKLINNLSENPERGTFPKELLQLGIREYRQVYFKPYRVIYRALPSQILIYLIADGRRDMQSLLERRLFAG